MELKRRSLLIYGLLAGVWLLVLGWQAQEHQRVKQASQNSLRNRSRDIAQTLGAFIRGLQFRGAVFGDRLQPVLDELVTGNNPEVLRPGEVLGVALLNAAGETVASSGLPLGLGETDIVQQGERWGRRMLTVVYPVEGANVPPDRGSNAPAPVLLPPFTNAGREGPRSFRRDSRGAEPSPLPMFRPPSSVNKGGKEPPDQPGPPDGQWRPRRPFWARGLNDQDYQAMIQKRELHGLVLGMSTQDFVTLLRNDLRTRAMIAFFATLAALGAALAWRSLSKSAELQIRLVRASEQNSHLREMNLAAAGLAHETRNPLNIIRGLAQMISREQGISAEVRAKSRDIVDEADTVAAQLNEFINYSRPREVRRTRLSLASVTAEVVRALGHDLEEKRIKLQTSGEPLTVEADEQLLRQALFNLLLNAVQSVEVEGIIEIVTRREGTAASLEVRDNGHGVLPEHRSEIFKPYFTTRTSGTGLGLAVVQQIVLAHGWEIEFVPNTPKGTIFRLRHIQVASS